MINLWMFSRRSLTLIVVILLLGTVFLGFVSSQESHENYEDVEEDISALFVSLNRTKEYMIRSLNHSQKVDYTQNINETDIQQSYDDHELKTSFSLSNDSVDNIEDSKEILKDIKGRVESYEYITEYYTPFYKMTGNLSKLVINHQELLSNLTLAGENYIKLLEGIDSHHWMWEGLRALNNASYNLKKMEVAVNSIEESSLDIDNDIFDTENLNQNLTSIEQLIEGYREYIVEFTFRFRTIESYLSIYAPRSTNPGRTINIVGFYIKDGEYQSNHTVEIFKDGVKIGEDKTAEDGYYTIEYTLPLYHSIEEVSLKASIIDENISSEDRTLNIVKYPSSIELDLQKEAYYNEVIIINGSFSTPADLDLQGFSLKTSKGMNVYTSDYGSFQMYYRTIDFDFGMNTVEVEYEGGRLIERSSSSVSFEISVPTELTLESDKSKEYEKDESIEFWGELKDNTSKEGMMEEEVSVILDEDTYKKIITSQNGEYSFSIDISSLDLNRGIHTVRTTYNGTKKYRDCSSKTLYIYIRGDSASVGDDPDDFDDDEDDENDHLQNLIEDNWYFIALIFGLLFLIFAYYNYSSGEEIEVVETGTKGYPSSKKSTASKTSLKASSPEEVPSIYRSFLNRLDESGIISLTKGKTHRDISSELSRKAETDENIEDLTNIFEKAYFTERSLSNSEINYFNSLIKNILKEVRA